MCGKKLITNLKGYLDPLIDIPVYVFDRNEERELPCVVVGYNGEDLTMAGIPGHYTVNGFVLIMFNGYDDLENEDGDSVTDDVLNALCDRDGLAAAMNKPPSGTDSRPQTAFHLHQLFVRGTTREIEDNSTAINVTFDAFTVACDL